MAIEIGSEFRIVAAPSEEHWRRLAYLAGQDSGAVATGGIRPDRADGKSRAGSADAAPADTILQIQMARLANPAYQAMSARINGELDGMDAQAVEALQNIEHQLLALRRERERMLEHAYRDGQGRPIAMTEDGTAAYYVTADGIGARVDDDEFLRIRASISNGPSVEDFAEVDRVRDGLKARGDQIRADMAEGEQLRDDLADGAISAEEVERRAQRIQETMAASISDAEAAILETRSDIPATEVGTTPDYEGPQETGSAIAPLVPRT